VRDAMAAPNGQPADAPRLAPDAPLDDALGQLAEAGASAAAVVEGGRVVGSLHVRDVVATYKRALTLGVRRARALAPGAVMFEARVGVDSPLAGRTLAEAGLPKGTLVVAVQREGETVFPRADTRVEVGDHLTVMSDPAAEPGLQAFLTGGVTLPAS